MTDILHSVITDVKHTLLHKQDEQMTDAYNSLCTHHVP